jgi:hypothetical protein
MRSLIVKMPTVSGIGEKSSNEIIRERVCGRNKGGAKGNRSRSGSLRMLDEIKVGRYD